jgi:hypothetical protein
MGGRGRRNLGKRIIFMTKIGDNSMEELYAIKG